MSTGPYSGKLVLLKLGSGTDAVAVMTAKSNGFTFTHSSVDTTTKKDEGYGSTLPGGGVTEVAVSLEGIFENTEYDKDLRQYGIDGSSNEYTLITGNGDTFVGNFVITKFSVGGNQSDAETYSFDLKNDGKITFTPGV